jgi:small-conductance mechanosensitive channel
MVRALFAGMVAVVVTGVARAAAVAPNSANIFVSLWRDLKQPSVLWQAAITLGCVVIAVLFARAAATRMQQRGDAIYTLRLPWLRLVFPATCLALLLLARAILGYWWQVDLLSLGVALATSLLIIRAAVFLLRRAFDPSGWVIASERFIELIVWGTVALHLSGLLPGLIGALDSVGLSVGEQRLTLWTVLQGIFAVVLTLVVALWLARVAEARVMAAESLHGNMRVALARFLRVVLVLLAVLITLPMVGIDLTALSVVGGALGVGVGLGLQRVAANYVSGFIILLDRSIRIGDMITTGGQQGVVTRMTTRYTVLRAIDGTEAIVPNETLISAPVLNHSFTDRNLRQSLGVQISYASDVDVAMACLTAVAARHPRVLKEPGPMALLRAFGESGIDLELGFWLDDSEKGIVDVISELNLAIWREFRDHDIEIPFPQREIRLKGELASRG